MIERMDQNIGEVLKKIEEKNFAKNTLIIFKSDNGASRSGSNHPFSGFKGSLFEGGIRVPCIVKWLGVLPEGFIFHQPCMTMDFTVSMLRAAGNCMPSVRKLDGIDILKWIETKQPVKKRILFWRARRGQRTRKAVRDGKIKYIFEKVNNSIREYLFDLANDPAEKIKLIR